MKSSYFKLILFLGFINHYLCASSIHERLQLDSSLIFENTCSKGLARLTLEPKLTHTHRKLDIIEEDDTLNSLPHPMPSSPYEIYGEVITTFKMGTWKLRFGEFGVLIGPSHVLTHAGSLFRHNFNFYDSNSIFEVPEEKIWAYKAVFTPYLKNKELGPQKISGHTLITPRQWVESAECSYKYGLIVLEEPIGETLGWAGLRAIRDYPSLEGKNITATFVNYRDHVNCPPYLKILKGKITNITSNQILYSLDSDNELTGRVVLSQERKGLGYSVIGFGTNSNKDIGDKKALRITPEIFRHLVAWQERNYPSVDQEIELKTYKKRADEDDPQAQFYMAEYYKNIKKNEGKAFRWYSIFSFNKIKDEKLASKAFENIGDYYSKVLEDIDLAIAHYKTSKSASSFHKIGEIYQEKGDIDQAQQWFQKSGLNTAIDKMMIIN